VLFVFYSQGLISNWFRVVLDIFILVVRV
jgi:hypothetical protein